MLLATKAWRDLPRNRSTLFDEADPQRKAAEIERAIAEIADLLQDLDDDGCAVFDPAEWAESLRWSCVALRWLFA